MLRISEAPAHGGIIGCLVPLALHDRTFEALHEALCHPTWTIESLGRLQVRLGQFDDFDHGEKAMACEILSMFGMLAHIRSHADAFSDALPFPILAACRNRWPRHCFIVVVSSSRVHWKSAECSTVSILNRWRQ